jgi:hypothetical protein
MRGATMDITTIVFHGFMGGSAAILLIFTCDLLATWMKRKEQVCVILEKGTKQ